MRRPRLTYANVMASAAMFVALGGTSYAAAKLAAKSVGERELKDGGVTTLKVKDGSLTARDLAPGTLQSGARGPRGSDGPAGPKGDTGATGATGATGPSEVISIIRQGGSVIEPAGNATTALASTTLTPGSWSIDGQVKIDYFGKSPEWLDCDISTAAGVTLIRATVRLGDAIGATITDTMPLTAAAKFDVATQLRLSCGHVNTVTVGITASNIVLRATRVGTLTER